MLATALKSAGVDVTFHIVRGAGHNVGGSELSQMVASFFDKHLKPEVSTVRFCHRCISVFIGGLVLD